MHPLRQLRHGPDEHGLTLPLGELCGIDQYKVLLLQPILGPERQSLLPGGPIQAGKIHPHAGNRADLLSQVVPVGQI